MKHKLVDAWWQLVSIFSAFAVNAIITTADGVATPAGSSRTSSRSAHSWLRQARCTGEQTAPCKHPT